ncbi:MAG: universal stress protein [Desulfobacterales bacterium]|nr:universal stress protein [Deltaproteobacteria bacterium]NNL75306.1 universal stress protein [Desulfobacterales bacterium]
MKFMVCYDGSDEAKEALKLAQHHASVWKAELQVINTIVRIEPLKHSQVKNAEEKLEKEVKNLLGGDDPPYETQLLLTDLTDGERLVKFAEEDKIDQIFLGIIKKSKVGKLLFGSTAQYVILHAPCPVVTVQK